MKATKLIALFIVAVILVPFICNGTVLCGTISSSGFYTWLRDSGIPEYSISGSYRANYSTFVKYNLVVYGKPGDVSGNEIKEGEYRYLGFTYSEGKYTNLDFPNDETGNLPPEQWDYVNVPGAGESWDLLEQIVQKPYMLYTQLKGHGATELTASDIGVYKAKVQSAASWNSSGSIYTFKSNGFYATFTVPSMGPGILTASMYPKDPAVSIYEDEFESDIYLEASVNKPADEIKRFKVVFSSGDWRKVRYYYDTSNIFIEIKAELEAPESLPDHVVINAVVSAESIFGDKIEKNINCIINVRRESGNPVQTPPVPIPSSTPTPGPASPTPEPTPVPIQNPPVDDDETPINILDFEITGSWNHWEGQPHRFLALEKIVLTIRAEGPANRAAVRMSPNLEAMFYTNSSGHTYDYSKDFFGYYVSFPDDTWMYPLSVIDGITTFRWEYCIPMCDETIGWDDDRKIVAYIIGCRVFGSGGRQDTAVIDDIDITGNIYELLYPQPAD
ncbi:MAG: hypothetical protein R3232_08300 [Clostridia bacterium]|nr:hypothetical protein [Clostridia bacterium]